MSSAETTNPNAPVSMIEKWDKTFAESSKVDHRKVTYLGSVPAEGEMTP